MNARFSLPTICIAITALVVPTLAEGSSVSIQAGDPRLPGVVSAVWRSPQGDVVHDFQMPVDGMMTSSDMAAATMQHLLSIPNLDPYTVSMTMNQVDVHSSSQLDPLDGVLPGGSIYWGTGTTAQHSMKLLTPDISHGTVAAAGHFDPFLQPGQPAIFTAGIVTDVGELTAQISSQELNFQTDGPIICQALFQRLAPRGAQFEAQINYAGDRLEVYFDPAYTVTQGGIIFGTTSPSQGFSGTITTPADPNEPIPGDSNGDGVVDAADYVYLRKVTGEPNTQIAYNVWRTHYGEMQGGVAMANGGIAIPEPATWMLLILAAAGISLRRRNY